MPLSQSDKGEPVQGENEPVGKSKPSSSNEPKKKHNWADYVIPRKKQESESTNDTDPYTNSSDEEGLASSDADESGSDGEQSDSESQSHGQSADGGYHRFDPIVSSSDFKLDESKEKYAKKFFNTHLSDERVNLAVLDSHPVPNNKFLKPPDIDDYIEDLVGDKKSFSLIKLQYQALKHVQKKLSRCLGPLSVVWNELESAKHSDRSTMSIDEITELIQKTILMLGQVNTACLYERRMSWLAKIFRSVVNANSVIKEYNLDFKSESKLFGSEFYKVLDRKAKNKKRAREMSREMRPGKRYKPFQSGPSGYSSKPSSRGSFTWKRGTQTTSVTPSRPKHENQKGRKYQTRYINKKSQIKGEIGSHQSPLAYTLFEHDRNRTRLSTPRGKNSQISSKLTKNNLRSTSFVCSKWSEIRPNRDTISKKRKTKF
ncbi:hypothetical protein KUTeg_000497 [Tegillarca granosa]|uniref:Uncharacterized protein n=1 Tax=Tegillarca granosa TaxID=220873 RepID=A0ABQ9FXR0_TEGGR|nr:hypothetical protein KUTeg_000497 [Tegillarca granosa]